MLGEVWKWAGRFRQSERNIGIPFYEIPAALRQLLDDAKAWIEYKSYPPDEIAVRFHHRLVQIHPFANGNGRLSPKALLERAESWRPWRAYATFHLWRGLA